MSDNTAGSEPAKDTHIQPETKAQGSATGCAPVKSHLKMVEELKEAAKPVPEIRAGGSQAPDPFDLASAIVDQEYLQAAAAGQVRRPPKIRTPKRNEFFRAFSYKQPFNL
jgi:hypothetical protein